VQSSRSNKGGSFLSEEKPVGLPNEMALEVSEAMISKLCEFMKRDIAEDIEKCGELDLWKQLELRAYWSKYIDLFFQFSERMRQYQEPERAFMLVVEQFGEQCGIGADELKPDVARRLSWYQQQLSKEFERQIEQDIEIRGISSPIEQIFLMQWRFLEQAKKHDLVLKPQQKVDTSKGNFRIDYEISDPSGQLKLAIELDGHEFHEKTKAQVARDKRRERAITFKGYTVLRYSGHEICNNVSGCIDEILSYAQELRPCVD